MMVLRLLFCTEVLAAAPDVGAAGVFEAGDPDELLDAAPSELGAAPDELWGDLDKLGAAADELRGPPDV